MTLFLEMLRSETAAKPEARRKALEGLRAYQEAVREPPVPLMPVIAERYGAQLRDYGGSGAPLLFIPSLINPPNILDLSAERSLLRWLAGQGHKVLLLDWGMDSASRHEMSVTDHVEKIIIPLVARLSSPPVLVGYCLGGTMALAAASLAPVRGLATIAAPWHFSEYPERVRTMLARLWEVSQPSVAALGVLPMEVLQSAFWSLDPARTIAKFGAFADMEAGSADARAFVTLEDWANDGPPITGAAAREIFESFFAEDRPGRSLWTVGGKPIDPATLSCPQLHIVSTSDVIVPGASAIRTGERLELDQGHVGMVVGGRARANLWEPLAAWLSHQPIS